MNQLSEKLRFLLFQIRDSDDPMRPQEIGAFSRALGCDPSRITGWEILKSLPSRETLDAHDMVLIGGAGRYSATSPDPWIEPILEEMRELCARKKPTFASCWGFQAMARAMGGTVENDLDNAELGTLSMRLTEAGKADPVFGPLGDTFLGQSGHEDHVIELPPDAVRLASSDRVPNEAYRMDGLPVYCTQFHPELSEEDLVGRLVAYPEYVERIAKMPADEFFALIGDTPETRKLLPRFVDVVFG